LFPFSKKEKKERRPLVLQQIQRPPTFYHLNGQDETKGTATAHRVTYTRNIVGSLT
jgi:hypothetical protein